MTDPVMGVLWPENKWRASLTIELTFEEVDFESTFEEGENWSVPKIWGERIEFVYTQKFKIMWKTQADTQTDAVEKIKMSVFFYSAFPGPLAHSRRFTNIITPADLNIPKPSRLPRKYTHATATRTPVRNNPHYISLSLVSYHRLLLHGHAHAIFSPA